MAKMPKRPIMMLTREDLQSLCNVTQKKVAWWHNIYGMPMRTTESGEEVIAGPDFLGWYVNHVLSNTKDQRKDQQKPETSATSFMAARLRLTEAQADVKEIEASQRRANLGPIDEMEMVSRQALVVLRTSLMGQIGAITAEVMRVSGAAAIRHVLLQRISGALLAAMDRLESYLREMRHTAEMAQSGVKKQIEVEGQDDRQNAAGKDMGVVV